jgi:hypothetical protein
MSFKKTDIPIFRINYGNRLLLFFLFFSCFQSFAQTEKENQFTNEYEFNRVTGKKTAIEFDLAHAYTSGINETNPFYKSSEMSGRLWVHYYTHKKWKFSGSIGYIYNRDVPEITKKKII